MPNRMFTLMNQMPNLTNLPLKGAPYSPQTQLQPLPATCPFPRPTLRRFAPRYSQMMFTISLFSIAP